MNEDFWIKIFCYCDILDVANLRLVCKSSCIKIDNEHFWKSKSLSDLKHISLTKKDNDSWFQYYKRCHVKYGEIIYQYAGVDRELLSNIIPEIKNNIKQCCSMKDDRLSILTNKGKLYIIDKECYLVIHKNPIKDICHFSNYHHHSNTHFFRTLFIDIDGDLYSTGYYYYGSMLLNNREPLLLASNVVSITRDNSGRAHYTTMTETYELIGTNNERLETKKKLDYPILSWIECDDLEYVVDFFIDNDKNLIRRTYDDHSDKFYDKFTNFKAVDISLIDNGLLAILDINNNLRFFDPFDLNKNYDHEFKFSNIKSIKGDSFITLNNELYTFNQNAKKFVFVDNNVVYIDRIYDRYEHRCYIKNAL
jgi:hypothetical protein